MAKQSSVKTPKKPKKTKYLNLKLDRDMAPLVYQLFQQMPAGNAKTAMAKGRIMSDLERIITEFKKQDGKTSSVPK